VQGLGQGQRAPSAQLQLAIENAYEKEVLEMRVFITGLAAALSALAFVAASASPAIAATCQPYLATGHDTATSPAGPFVGVQDITLGGTMYTEVPAVTSILAPLTAEGHSGVLTTTTSHAISLPIGTITTTDAAHLIPTGTPGVYKLVEHMVITGGATGQLELRGTVSFITLTAEGTFVGTVCGLG
jgi:hypothetical protein